MSEIRQFLESLFGAKPDDTSILIWRWPEKRSEWFFNLERAAEYAEKYAASDLYVGVGLSPQDYGPTKRCEAANVCGLPALWIDFDVLGPAHQKQNLPGTAAEALSLLPPEFPPSLVVHSGHGLHAYWIFREIELIQDEGDRERLKSVIKRWERCIRLRAQERGWTIDATHDLARILRIPGTTNTKIKDVPIVAHIKEDHPQARYNLSEFEDYLDDMPLLATSPAAAAREIATPTVQPGLLKIASDRALPGNKLARFLEDVLFFVTWNHNRSDFIDKSQSAYDLAIGNALYEAGCSDQEIVDGLIQNRREHGAASKLHRDYYARTLRAIHGKRRCGDAAAIVARSSPAQPAVTSPAGPPATEPPKTPKPPKIAIPEEEINIEVKPPILGETPEQTALRRAGLWQALSTTLGLTYDGGKPNITRIVKITGNKPTWRIDLNDGRAITLTNVFQLRDYEAFSSAVFAAINKELDKVYKRPQWKKVVQVIADSLIEIQPGTESTDEGLLRAMLDWYLGEVGVAHSCEDAFAKSKDQWGPFSIDGQIAVHQRALQSWVAKARDIKKESQELANAFTGIGAKVRRFEVGKGRQPQSRWMLPADEFDPETYRKAEVGSRLGVDVGGRR